MREIHWLEAKQLDRVTNYSTETEVIKTGKALGINVQYYCTFLNSKKDFGLVGNINYLGSFKNRYLKAVEFKLSVIAKSLKLILKPNIVIIVNQDLIKYVMPAYYLNKWLGKGNKFVVDIRTTPTNPSTFDKEMDVFHKQFRIAVKYFDGLSFITPYMQRYLMDNYKVRKPSVNWSSGVDLKLFNRESYFKENQKSPFTVFYHGGISISRGNLNLIKACEQLIQQGYVLHLIQIGICVDEEIKTYIKTNNLEMWCKLLPPVPLDEIPQIIANSDLPVLPFPNFLAWRVSSPIKLMEYLAMGKKVLAPNMEAFTDVFKNKPELIFYYNTNAKNQISEISHNISQIIDKSLTQEVKQEDCVNFVSSHITWEKQTGKLLNFCLNL